MPLCRSCKEDKSLESFADSNKKTDGSYGKRSLCKTCYKRVRPKRSKEQTHKAYLEASDAVKANVARWAKANPEKVRAYKERWKQRHPEQYKKSQQAGERRRLKENPCFKIAKTLRNRLNSAVKNGQKAGSAVSDLGCSVDELKFYLESKFYIHPVTGEEMSWKNYSYRGWHIDHIKPLCKFDLTDRAQFLEACHYSNLRPMWMLENMRKSGYYDETQKSQKS